MSTPYRNTQFSIPLFFLTSLRDAARVAFFFPEDVQTVSMLTVWEKERKKKKGKREDEYSRIPKAAEFRSATPYVIRNGAYTSFALLAFTVILQRRVRLRNTYINLHARKRASAHIRDATVLTMHNLCVTRRRGTLLLIEMIGSLRTRIC
jgi:hypothetical protein